MAARVGTVAAMETDETVGGLLAEGRARLAASFFPPLREAALLLARAAGLSEVQVMAHEERAVARESAARFRGWLDRRVTGEPVAYLFGEREFYGRPFQVDRRVLIPRPETEHLIEAVLATSLPAAPRILDVGTGSGCIAITLACELPAARLVATDLSAGALDVARQNARRLEVAGRTRFARADLCVGIDLGKLDLLVSNPPYVDGSESAKMSPEVCNFEPHLALFPPGGRGEETIARLLDAARGLRRGVRLILEIGHGQLDAVQSLAAGSGFGLVEARADYAGIARIVVLQALR